MAFVRKLFPLQALFAFYAHAQTKKHVAKFFALAVWECLYISNERERIGVLMRRAVSTKSAFSCGGGALNYLQQINCKDVVIIMDNRSESDRNLATRIESILREKNVEVSVYEEMSAKPDLAKLLVGLAFIKQKMPDTIIAVGDDATINAAKLMMLLYEYPKTDLTHMENEDISSIRIQTKFIVVSSSSENATGISQIGTIMIDDEYIVTKE